MRIGVMSDTHGNLEFMFHATDALVREHGATVLFHLGDDYRDAESLRRAGHEVRAVPGLWCPEYERNRVPRRLLEHFDGVSIACAHALEEITGSDRRSDILLHGHTHRPAIQERDHSIVFNPGHLKEHRSRGQIASYGLIDIEEKHLSFFIYRIDGLMVQQRRQPRKPPVEE